jgi:hypothetical protein
MGGSRIVETPCDRRDIVSKDDNLVTDEAGEKRKQRQKILVDCSLK